MLLVKISMKHNDMAEAQLVERENGAILAEKGNGIPFVGVFVAGGEDYTELTIDNETGKIVGWVPLTTKDFEW